MVNVHGRQRVVRQLGSSSTVRRHLWTVDVKVVKFRFEFEEAFMHLFRLFKGENWATCGVNRLFVSVCVGWLLCETITKVLREMRWVELTLIRNEYCDMGVVMT